MPPLPDRDGEEEGLGALLLALLQDWKREAIDGLGDPPSV